MYRAIRGTRDILPEEMGLWHRIEDTAREVFELYGYGEMRVPIFEETTLFSRSIGKHTDIVEKEMYTFTDRSGKSLTLRPEATAGVVRAWIEHHLDQRALVGRYYYIGPMFRYERPQKGRYRQFHQIDAEIIGESHPAVDAELIEMLFFYLNRLGLKRANLMLNSIGCPRCRPGYLDKLRRQVKAKLTELCSDCQSRSERNTLRIFDCKNTNCQGIINELPAIEDHLCSECSRHFQQVQSYLRRFGIEYKVSPRLVRGLDYYTRTTFEFTYPGLGAQNAIMGGGRYDGLVALLGGKETPAIGVAIGSERLVLALKEEGISPPEAVSTFLVTVGEEAFQRGMELIRELRHQGVFCLSDYQGRSLRGQLRLANKLGCQAVLILGEDELKKGVVTLKMMSDGSQQEVALDLLPSTLRRLLYG
ncbi:histidine--tRNA ligase [bacterium (candidate division B38) B3_B38]|nr:MAG: histidine--tRNA ligase [bacterium (candidate division B38) B3_B38]